MKACLLGLSCLLAFASPALHAEAPAWRLINVAPVWAGHPVTFPLLTVGDRQFTAFYDAERRMTLAARALDSQAWQIKRLDSTVGWDSHNSIAIAVDRSGCLHVSGNMHNVPLVYFRGTRPLDIQSVAPIHRMTGEREGKATYPVFLKGPDNELIFNYRDGSSGNGSTLYNVYDEATGSWRRLIDTPLFDGEGKMNSYPKAPFRGPDGWFHMTWLWRDTPMAETNHDLCYARSRDLRSWETADGKPLELPFRLGTAGTLVDPVPVNGGIINGTGDVGFDPAGRTVISYHKYDEAGMTQLYLARHEGSGWKIHLASEWDYRWDFSGGGSLSAEIGVGPLEINEGKLGIQIRHPKAGSGFYEVDPVTLRLLGKIARPGEAKIPGRLGAVVSDFPGMTVNWRPDSGAAPAGKEYRLRWETLGRNRDRPWPKPWPGPSMLQVLERKGP